MSAQAAKSTPPSVRDRRRTTKPRGPFFAGVHPDSPCRRRNTLPPTPTIAASGVTSTDQRVFDPRRGVCVQLCPRSRVSWSAPFSSPMSTAPSGATAMSVSQRFAGEGTSAQVSPPSVERSTVARYSTAHRAPSGARARPWTHPLLDPPTALTPGFMGRDGTATRRVRTPRSCVSQPPGTQGLWRPHGPRGPCLRGTRGSAADIRSRMLVAGVNRDGHEDAHVVTWSRVYRFRASP
jgi:hypothetical protein